MCKGKGRDCSWNLRRGSRYIDFVVRAYVDFDTASKVDADVGRLLQPLRCEECGMTYTQFSKAGRFGCRSCYEYFDERLNPLFKKVHGSTTHVGKIPKRGGSQIQVKRQLDDLKVSAKRIIEEELKDNNYVIKFRELEKGLSE